MRMDDSDLKAILEDLSYLIEQKDEMKLRNLLVDMHPADIAAVLAGLSDEKARYLFGLLSPDLASRVLVELDEYTRDRLLETLETTRISEIVDEMNSDDAADVVSDLPKEVAQEVLESIDKQDSEEVRELLRHEEDTAGGRMALEFVSVNEDATVAEAIQEIRRKAEEVGEAFHVYVVDDEGHLVGVLPLKRLVLSDADVRVRDIMDRDVIKVNTETDQEEVARIFQKYNLVSLPVVDWKGRLVGQITVDDAMEVMEEEATEDIHRLAGVPEEEQARETSIFKISRGRLPWLLFAFAGELCSALVLFHFQASLNQILAVAFFIPIIMALGGASGNQVATVVVRGLATGEISSTEISRKAWRELKVSLVNGFFLAILIFLVVDLWLKDPQLGLVIGASMVAVIFASGLIGTLIPILLHRLGYDPAYATAPFIATTNDVLGLTIYLFMVTQLLRAGWLKEAVSFWQ